MNFNSFRDMLLKAKAHNPIWFELNDEELANENQIKKLENDLEVIFPSAYKDFLLNIGGGEFTFTNIFSLKEKSEWNIQVINEELNLLPSFLAISDNQVGDYFGFKVSDGKCEELLSFFDHENQEIKRTEYENLFEYLADVGLRVKS